MLAGGHLGQVTVILIQAQLTCGGVAIQALKRQRVALTQAEVDFPLQQCCAGMAPAAGFIAG